ncbi:MAG: peptidylprolyl isomerase, partial [Bdellovibrionales bacterium]
STEEEAQKVFASAQKNNDLKTALETITGNASAFIPAKAMHENETLDELKAPVFTAEKPAILAPVQTPLGWSIIDLQAITPAATTPFETAKEDIKQDLLTDRLSEDIYALADEVDEFFAAGGTPQEAKTQFDLDIKTFENIDNFGLNPEQDETFRDTFGADINETITTAFDLEENETSAIFERETGDFVALHIQNITPKSYQPLESVKDSITQKWIADQQKADNAAKVKTLLTENTDTSLDAIAKGQGKTAKTLTGLTRDTEGKTPLTAESLSAVFKADQNMPVIMPIENGFAIAEITQVTLPQTTDDSALAEVKTKIARDQQNELMMIYINQLRGQYGAKINEDLLQRAYGTQEETY